MNRTSGIACIVALAVVCIVALGQHAPQDSFTPGPLLEVREVVLLPGGGWETRPRWVVADDVVMLSAAGGSYEGHTFLKMKNPYRVALVIAGLPEHNAQRFAILTGRVLAPLNP